jgi:hypothetical protein
VSGIGAAMDDNLDSFAIFAIAELSQLRAQALDLFDRCLAERNPAPILSFIEKQVMGDPPHLPLLREFAAGLQQRLISLHAYHFDVRDKVTRTFADYGVDITPFLPSKPLPDFHRIEAQKIMEYARQKASLVGKDLLLLTKLLEASIQTTARLTSEIEMTTELQNLSLDWLEALNATVGRRYWSESSSTNQTIH